MTYPHDSLVSEYNLKAENDLQQARLLYWNRLRLARREYTEETGTNDIDIDKFSHWMNNKYGLQLEFIDGNISGAYTITNEKKMMMFTLKYPR